MSVYEGLIHHYNSFGLRGILAITSHRLFGHPKGISVRREGMAPVYIRLRTTDFSVYSQILLEQGYKFELPFSPKTILDGGANTGMASIYFANRYPAAKIFAIEAEASNFSVLVQNVRSYPSIVPIHAALWNRDGEVVVDRPDPTTPAHDKWGFVTHDGNVGNKVRAVTVRSIIRELQIPSFDLVKLDIEGAEQEVFEDTSWLTHVRCLMIEVHEKLRPGCASRVESAMGGYTRTQRGETTFYLRKDTA